MLAATVFTVIIATFGQIRCAKLNRDFWNCPDESFDDPGYSLDCTYNCVNGNPEDLNTYWGRYRDGTVCVSLKGGDTDKFDHIGTCENGICVEYKKENIQDIWNTLPGMQPQFHNCNPKSSKEPVDKCLHICNKTQPAGKSGLFFGIYLDHNPCKLADGKTGECRSGLCVEITGTYPIEN
uniref:Putative basic tail protein n=1 Tax=Ixodes ricinus TaxID=34613 RepID=A0A0K8R4S3_IXORI